MRYSRLGLIGATVAAYGFMFLAIGLLAQAPPAEEKKAVPPPPPPPPAKAAPPVLKGLDAGDKAGYTDRVTLQTDPKAERKIDAAQLMIKDEDWGQAVTLLQAILDVKEDVFLRTPDEKGRRVTVRAEANRMLGAMPKDGLQFYEQQYGPVAANLLRQAKSAGDPQVFADVALRYMHTEAGIEATALMGAYHLDQGRNVVAALCFRRLLDRQDALQRLPLISLYQAALAFERTGDKAGRDRVWGLFAARFKKDELPPNLRRFSLSQLQTMLARKGGEPGVRRAEWPVFMGSADRSAQSEGSAPFLERRWAFPNLDKGFVNYASQETLLKLNSAFDKQNRKKGPVLTGMHPVVVAGKLVFRSYWGVHAVDLKTGELLWEAPTSGSLDHMIREQPKLVGSSPYQTPMDTYFNSGSHALLYSNTLLGTLSTDTARVYLVNDVALPPPQMIQPGWARPVPVGGDAGKWADHNRLEAYDLESGKLIWDLGTDKQDEPFSDTFFLGPPLPLGDKLYALVEVNSEIRLLCLDPAHGSLIWSQSLCVVKNKLLDEAVRRTQAVNLAYGDGILVCPTNAGIVLGLDLLTRSLAWAHSYQEAANGSPPPPILNRRMRGDGEIGFRLTPSTWEVSAPIIRDGKVVFTAPDGQAIHCINLADGSRAWVQEQKQDLYLAGVYRGKVLLVGKESCRALNLNDGSQAWMMPTGLPSGRGIANADTFFLPLKQGAVWAINIDTGKVIANPSPGQEIPGNLVFYGDDVISQTAVGIVSYPQLAAKERIISDALAKNPNDPVGLTERGELRIHQGDLAGAVADLRTAIRHQPAAEILPRTRQKLYEALGKSLERNFAANEQHLKEYEELALIPTPENEAPEAKSRREQEQLNRRAHFLRLVAKGREDQGRVVDAFQAYMDFANLGVKELLAAPDEPSLRVRADVWAQGRITALAGKATPEQVKALAGAFEAQWKKTQAAGDVESLRWFVNLLGQLCPQGRQARLALAERLIQGEQFLEAESHLLYLRKDADAALAARAVEKLAQLMLQKGLLEDAAYYYRILGREHAETLVRDGMTGAQLYQEAATDKRLLPYLDEPRQTWLGGRDVSVELVKEPNMAARYTMFLEPEGELLPFFQRHRFGVKNMQELHVAERISGETRHSLSLIRSKELPVHPYFQNTARSPRLVYRLHGHLVVFTWGQHVYGYDPIHSKELWRVNLLEGMDDSGPGRIMALNLMMLPTGELELTSQMQERERVGRLGNVSAECACFFVRDDGLRGVDPLTGQTRWVKTGVSASTEVFGDDQHLFLVPPERSSGGGKGIAIRAADGKFVETKDFAKVYRHRNRLGVVGRNILVRDSFADGSFVIRLYDSLTCQDVWERQFPAKTVFLNSQEAALTGAIDPTGQISVIDVLTGAETLRASVDSAHLTPSTTEAHLVLDRANYYILFNSGWKDRIVLNRRNMPPFSAPLRGAEVSGAIYAFDRTTGKERWRQHISPQVLVLEEFADLPLLIFASSESDLSRPPQSRYQGKVMAFDKADGRQVHPRDGAQENINLQQDQFHSLNLDRRSGTIELLSHQRKLVFRMNHELPKGAAGN